MNDFIVDMAVTWILSFLKLAIKNEEKKNTFRRAMLKIATQIEVIYGDDSEFAEVFRKVKAD